jgi:hypothetical protein
MQAAFEARSSIVLFNLVAPLSDVVRAHPFFQELSHKVGLPEEAFAGWANS